MRRRILGPLLIGYVLGLGTLLLMPDLRYERRTWVVELWDSEVVLQSAARTGWIVLKVERSGNVTIIQLERPRYLSITEGVSGAATALRDLVTGGFGSRPHAGAAEANGGTEACSLLTPLTRQGGYDVANS